MICLDFHDFSGLLVSMAADALQRKVLALERREGQGPGALQSRCSCSAHPERRLGVGAVGDIKHIKYA